MAHHGDSIMYAAEEDCRSMTSAATTVFNGTDDLVANELKDMTAARKAVAGRYGQLVPPEDVADDIQDFDDARF